MKKHRQRNAKSPAREAPGRSRWFLAVLLGATIMGGAVWWQWGRGARVENSRARILTTPTFNRDIAPIIFHHCSSCHRPGQSAPFSLLTYADAKKHAQQIAEVTGRHEMPPWLAENVGVKYLDERHLSEAEIGTLARWVEQGGVEGAAGDLPVTPKWPEGWQRGKPDLVLEMPETFITPAEGRDVYHNFVLPVSLNTRRYVAAMEFHVGSKAVHHASMPLDPTPESRLLDAKEPGPGFAGMDLPGTVVIPDGHFLSWQPGRDGDQSPAGLPWALEPGMDAVLQLHLQPTGKPEPVRCSVGLYCTNRPPTNAMFKICLTSLDFEIPAGKKDFVVEDSYVLPVDVEVRGVKPHTHYLAKDLQAVATRPDGTRQWLLHIPQWNFFWQQDYRLADPIRLPRGTRLTMRYTFDNSADNPRNPHHPPRNVRYGPQTTDEMAELWIQVVAGNARDLARLASDARDKAAQDNLRAYAEFLRRDPRDAKTHAALGRLLFLLGRMDEAAQHLRASLEISPANDLPHYYLGVMQRGQNQLAAARTEFETALRINPDHYKAHGNLAQIAQTEGRLAEAEQHARAALKIFPGDTLSRETLDTVLRARGGIPARPAQ